MLTRTGSQPQPSKHRCPTWCYCAYLQAVYAGKRATLSIGNIKPFFSYEYPRCYKNHLDGCSANLTRGPDYSQVGIWSFSMLPLAVQ